MNIKLKIALAVVFLYLFGFIGSLHQVSAATNYQLCKTGSSCTVGEYLYDDSYSPITNATCVLTSRYPNGSLYINAQAMTSASQNDGWYSYTFDTTGQAEGIYRSQVCCDTADGQHLCLDKTFQIGPQLSTSDVSQAVWDEQTSSHSGVGTFGNNLQQQSPSASDTAAAVWSFNGGRTLSSFGDLVSQIWSYTTGSLDSFGSLLSDTWTTLQTGILGNGQQIATKTNIDNATSAATLAIKGASNIDLTQANTAISVAQTSLDSISAKVDTLNTKIDTINTNTAAILTKWGSYSMSDVIGYVNDITTGLGSNSDTCSTTTVFGGIQCIKDKWGTQTASGLYASANNAATTSAALLTELNYNGKSTTAYQDIQTIEGYVNSLNTSVGTSSDPSSIATIFGKIQGARDDIASGVSSIKGVSNKDLSQVTTQVAGVQTSVNTISGKIDDLSATVGNIDTTTTSILNKWGSYSFSDIVSTLSTVTTGLGTNSDTCSNNTVFGQIACIKAKWGTQTADSLYTAANNAAATATALQTELNYNGKSTTAYQDLQTLITNITAVQSLIGTTNDNSSVASLYGRLAGVQSTISNLNTSGAGLSDLLDKWGSYSATDLYNKISSISDNVSTNNSIPDVSSILTVAQNNSTDLQSLKNSVLALQALTLANKALLENGTAQPIIQTWLEQGSIIFKTLITNPSDITQTIPFKFYLPKEATKADIEKMDDGLTVGYDPTQAAYYVTGSIVLGPSQTHIYAVEVTDIWKISAEEINSIKIQAQQLYSPLKGTSYFAQGATLYSDIIASLDDATNIQNQAQTPDDRIQAYRAALVDVNKAKSEVGDLKTLDTSASSAGNLLGSVGGVQTTAVWGLVLVLTAGFVFLAIYMRMLMVQAKSGRKEKTGIFKELSMQVKADLAKLKEKLNIKTVSFAGAAVCSLFAIFLLGKILLSISSNNTHISQRQSASVVATKKIADMNSKTADVKDKKEVLGTAVVNKNQVMILVGNTAGINIRQGPSVLTQILTSIRTNTIATKINDLNGWTEVQTLNDASKSAVIKGWVKDDYISNIEK